MNAIFDFFAAFKLAAQAVRRFAGCMDSMSDQIEQRCLHKEPERPALANGRVKAKS